MIRTRISELPDGRTGHFLGGLLPGSYLGSGGLAFAKPGERSHTNDGPGGRDYHVHGDREAFVILQGKGAMEVNGELHDVATGDIVIVEPGEDHHLHSSQEDPIVALWCHAGGHRHLRQREEGSA
ncbi:cupin domain-containing protein [Cohnella sp. REN36]|uniref:cupin domain-containing protein n=1 Tax=Cohnella sp. REN36 TaxID=2887347 RepID=UPI001D13A3CF|nr:cupin domain-containing protein [Cohnella sp. REN36]MCC3374539.1 cupin domain-containing protein [Cohnella sp. REN36]